MAWVTYVDWGGYLVWRYECRKFIFQFGLGIWILVEMFLYFLCGIQKAFPSTDDPSDRCVGWLFSVLFCCFSRIPSRRSNYASFLLREWQLMCCCDGESRPLTTRLPRASATPERNENPARNELHPTWPFPEPVHRLLCTRQQPLGRHDRIRY